MSLLALFTPQRSPETSSALNNDASGLGEDKKWPQVFTFSDERVNLDKFEVAKKKSASNDETTPGLSPRSSYLILHGGNYV